MFLSWSRIKRQNTCFGNTYIEIGTNVLARNACGYDVTREVYRAANLCILNL